MPPLLDAHPTFGPQPVTVALPAASAIERFPAGFYDMARPVGNAGRNPWPATSLRSLSIHGLVRLANTAVRAARLVRRPG